MGFDRTGERPDLADVLYQPFFFSRQAEEAPDEAAFYTNPVFDFHDGRFFGKWNRNRIISAQNLEGVPKLSTVQVEAMEFMDEILRRPGVMYTMYLEPGDMQILPVSPHCVPAPTSSTTKTRSKSDSSFGCGSPRPTPQRFLRAGSSYSDLYANVLFEVGSWATTTMGACRAFDSRQAAEHAMSHESSLDGGNPRRGRTAASEPFREGNSPGTS